jgi:carbamoyltransferase
VANYYYKDRLKDINLYVDPISHDGGTAMGLAKLGWYVYNNTAPKNPLKHIYLGAAPNYSILDNILKQVSGIKTQSADFNDVADLLVNGNIVSLFHGRPEGGPRALGNRSILFDPRRPDGKDFVNRVKGREWFRPFAASVMEEHAEEWFEMRGLKSSPFMMYAINLSAKHIGDVPSVTHVDGTCRVQTVNEADNLFYYRLIDAFYKKTGVPMVFNTSFNLSGDPLVETLVDAVNTIIGSDIKYLYLPDIGKLLVKE